MTDRQTDRQTDRIAAYYVDIYIYIYIYIYSIYIIWKFGGVASLPSRDGRLRVSSSGKTILVILAGSS